uniref:G_PROTEIN_RECEP_F1_2 domain-containing protein n=1 Tax=Panagrellus redivivus TaxID=6233 RepID=A0A7E4ZSD3_PANRE
MNTTEDPISAVLQQEMSNFTSDNDSGIPFNCDYYEPPLTEIRFWIVSVFGTIVSLVSITQNLFIFFLFLNSKSHRTSYNKYLMLLAFFDVFVSLAYILLMSVNVLSDYLRSAFLIKLWMHYMIPMITVSHIAITSSSFLILAATYERFCITTNSSHLRLLQRNRNLIAFLAVLIGVISKGSMYFEFTISVIPECEGLMTELALGFKDFVFDTSYHTVWRFWYRNFVTIFFPFFMLAYYNIRIVKALSHQQKQSCVDLLNNSLEQTKRKKTTRSATRTMILVVCCYLVSNIINVLLTVWEHVDKTSLAEKYDSFYALALDFVSLATNLSCAFRVPIYLACQAALREEIFFTIKRWSHCRSAEHLGHCQNNTSPQTPGSPENVCLINGHFAEMEPSTTSDGVPSSEDYQLLTNNNSNHAAHGDTSGMSSLRSGFRGNSRERNGCTQPPLMYSFDDDQQSTSSSLAAHSEEILKRIIGTHNETML